MEFVHEDLPVPPGIRLVPGQAFFVRVLDRPPGLGATETEEYVRLSIETSSPFPPAQLSAGWHEAGSRIVAWAAYRKGLPEPVTEGWEAAARVIPDFAPALVWRPATVPALHVWETEGAVTGVLWDTLEAPSAVVPRLPGTEPAYFRRRFGLAESVPVVVRRPSGAPVGDASRVDFPAAGMTEPLRVRAESADTWDVRPADFLSSRRSAARRGARLWAVVVGGVAVAAVLLLAEVARFGMSAWIASREAVLGAREPEAAAVGTALSLAHRLEQLGGNRIVPLEMFRAVVEPMPETMAFSRAEADGPVKLMARASTPNAADVSVYETALRASPVFSSVEIRDLQAEGARTTFALEVVFKSAPVPEVPPAPQEGEPEMLPADSELPRPPEPSASGPA